MSASVDGDERLRLFVGFPLPAGPAEALADWAAALGAARPVPAENLHLTIAFLGSRPAGDVERATEVLVELRGLAAPCFRVAGYRETRSVAMLVFQDEDGRGARIAGLAHEGLERRGLYRREARPWLPHVTVLRHRVRPRLDPALPALGEVCPSDAALYNSVLRSTGAQYRKITTVPLGR